MSDIIQGYYKRNDLNHIEELLMRVTNYAWEEMTFLQQTELREKAAADLVALQAESKARLTRAENAEAERDALKIILAWQMGELSEGRASALIGVDRLKMRTMRDDFIAALAKGEPK